MKRPEDATPNYLLRNVRESYGWTQEELAEKIGTTGVTISRWENGITFPNRYFRKKLSNLYGKSIQELGLFQEENTAANSTPLSMQNSIAPADGALERSAPLFLFNEPLPEPQELYGQYIQRETMINRTSRKASTSIVGPRRIGKTWLLSYLLMVAERELGPRFRLKYLDATMPSCRTVIGFVAEVLEEFGLRGFNVYEGLISLERGLKALKTKGVVPVLCIDEFEGFSNRQEFTLDFFRALRAMTNKCDLVLVTVSRHPLRTIVGKDVETSGFFNIFEQLQLESFTEREAAEFIQAKSCQACLTPLERDLLWKYGEENEREWPPLRLQLVGKMLMDAREHTAPGLPYGQHFEQRLETMYREAVY